MTKVAIFGSTGMIGSTVARYFSTLNYEITEFNRVGSPIVAKNQVVKFDALTDDLSPVLAKLGPGTVIINLIGMIRHKIDEASETSKLEAKKVNSMFPRNLVGEAKNLGFKVIQIATDCIYSGNSGRYSETSKADPIDIYGLSKLEGEFSANNLLTLRVSVVGNEHGTKVELLEWVLAHPLNSEISGFVNHLWNGVTSLQFAKIVSGAIDHSENLVGTYHVVPDGNASKFELIREIAELSNRPDLRILETEASNAVDRTLITNYAKINENLWLNAGYTVLPTIRIMLEEYFEWNALSNLGDIST